MAPSVSDDHNLYESRGCITEILELDPAVLCTLFENGTFPTFPESVLKDHQDLLYRKLALCCAQRGEYETAAELLLAIPPYARSYESSVLLAFVFMRMENYSRALAIISDLQAQYPDDLKLDNARAYLLCKVGSCADARRIMERVVQLVPEYGPFLDTWGTILAAEGRICDAERAYKKAYQLLPDDGEVLAHLAELLRQTGRISDAQDAYQRSVRLDPTYGEGQKGYARVLMDLGRYAEAQKALQAALRLIPGDAELISWEQETDSRLLAWYTKQQQEANRTLFIKRVVQGNHS